MTTFLFWNLGGKPLADRLARMANNFGVDVLILAECEVAPGMMLETLNRQAAPMFHHHPGQCERIAIYARFSSESFSPHYETDRISIRRLSLLDAPEILLVSAHLPSKLHADELDQYQTSSELSAMIRQAEENVGHTRTILVGDLNMNPFENGAVSAGGLHGVMTREIAQKDSRTIQGHDYPFFYNPMWGLFGDGSEGPAGSYYYAKSGHETYFWNIFDQVLLRPALLPYFRNDDLKILTSDGVETLLTERGLPDDKAGSDHLPIMFKLHL
ncbi:MAG: endonuclease/exonuclease/phosphatase family protein [Blastocatellia bacterium]